MPILSADDIKKTCVNLRQRVVERFPDSGLLKTYDKLLTLSGEVDATITWIKRPNYFVKISSWLAIGILVISLVHTWRALNVTLFGMNVADFFQMIDAGFNSVILLSAAGIFLMTSELRRKRRRVINAVNKLRSLAHIIDAHQLTKDPHSLMGKNTEHSPQRTLSVYELGRYLDYCSEMLSLTSKVAFLYVQDFDDPVANDAVNDLEILANGFSQKIWLKMIILSAVR